MVLVGLCWPFCALFGQDTLPQRPKVGVVLSGGGAKGMAHIGALKIMEEAGVKIDYIGGTSMGAIVGALYASGYTATQLDSMFRAVNFGNLIQDNLPRSAKSFYEKEDSERYALTLPFNNFRVTVPSGFSSGQNIYNELIRLLYHVKDVEDFSKLPIPFVCIATNVETGEEVVLRQGYLPEAIVASGTLPSLFEPTSIEGKMLIDGGVVNNYPIEKVREMGADIIIGVDVQHGLSDREALGSATEILLQINNYRTVQAMQKKAADTDIYIKPKIDQYSVIDFGRIGDIIKSGEVAAIEHFAQLKEIGSPPPVKTLEPVRVMGLKDSITVNSMVLRGSNSKMRGFVKGKLRFNLGEPVSFEKFQQGINNLTATGRFRSNRYKLISNFGGQDLIMTLEDTPNTSFLRLGVHYDDLYKSAALLNYTRKELLFTNDVASFDLILGDNLRYNLEYYIDKGSYWSFGINSRFNDFQQDIPFALISSNFDVPPGLNVNSLNFNVTDITNQLYIQTVLREEFAFILGVEHKFIKYGTRTFGNLPGNTEAILPNTAEGRTLFEKSNYYSTYARLVLDTYDDTYFPRKGLLFDGDFHYYLLSSDFNNNFKDFSVSKARMGMALPLGNKWALNVETEGGFKLGTSSVSTFDFVLGGFGATLINNFVPFYGYDFLSLPGNSYVKAYARLDFEVAPKNHFLFAANFANVDDDLFRTGEWFAAPNFSGYGLGYAWESFVGPLQLMYSWSPEGNNYNVFISLGHWF
jgi:NTE family protein